MTDLFDHFRGKIAERFELLIDGEPHGDGGFQRAWNMTCEYEVERAYVIADLARQSDALG